MRATIEPVVIDHRDVHLITLPVNARALVSALRGVRRLVGDRPALGLAVVVNYPSMTAALHRAFHGAVSMAEAERIIRTAVRTEVARASR